MILIKINLDGQCHLLMHHAGINVSLNSGVDFHSRIDRRSK